VTTVVSLDGDQVVGFAQMLSDGEIQAYLAAIAVSGGHRRQGIARRLIGEALERARAIRVDLITETAEPFYETLTHKRFSGFRIYPPFN
jgi:ribosomal protein S18 acetylase RimI-like enzyme